MILAGIDIGTNTLRLLIADTGPRSFHEIHSDRRITRLGAELDRTGKLSVDARGRSLAVLFEFSEKVRNAGCRAVAAVGTSALRRAVDSAEFLEEVRLRTGLKVRVVDGSEEARLTLLGVSRAMSAEMLSRGAMVIDIGGGSTEIVIGEGSAETSLPLGAVYLSERFLAHDPVQPDEFQRLRAEVRRQLRSSLPSIVRPPRLIGTAGTITTLAAMHQQLTAYDPVRINGSCLTRDWVADTVQRLAESTAGERRTMPGLEQGREDIILAGAVVLQEIMDTWQYPELLVSDWGLREGILFDLYDTIRAED
jgi:exopolyphosphatase/guanosine-5'-triphosphate,3'-diphosphate pyrophosphatase